jgi:hypothetical protein
MKLLNQWLWVRVALMVTLAIGQGVSVQAAPNPNTKKNKVILYPSEGDSIDQLTKLGIKKVRNYGTFWLVEADDAELQALKQAHGKKMRSANHLNTISLANQPLNTTEAEPDAKVAMKETKTSGKRLRLVQFSGPVLPEWVEQLKETGKAKIVQYIPHNAYLVRMDAATEKKLAELMEPNGPIQYVGAYHPSYKVKPSLLNSAAETVAVRIAVVRDGDTDAALQGIQRYALDAVRNQWTLPNHVSIEATVRVADLSAIAAISEVLWVRKVVAVKTMDEAQAVAVATNPDSPEPKRYLDFLLDTVGFSEVPSQYPVLDICDTGLDADNPNGTGSYPYHPSFYAYRRAIGGAVLSPAENPAASFSVYPSGAWPFSSCNPSLPAGRIEYNLAGTDTEGHGTVVASVAAGWDDQDDEQLHCLTQQGTNGDPNCLVITHEPPSFIARRDQGTGFQYGLGISPYGRIGASSFVAAAADPFGIAWRVYLNGGARLSNNSWGEVFSPGDNDGIYSDLSQAYDTLTRDVLVTGNPNTPRPWPLSQEVTYIFAGGNANGYDGTGYGDVLVTPPATAKNVITVGAGDDFGVASYSSFGPTEDGRYKPEVVAPGSVIGAVSQAAYAHDNCAGCDPNFPVPQPCEIGNYLVDRIGTLYFLTGVSPTQGTSFSAPAVSGSGQLLWWYFNNRLRMLQPSPAMTRAYIINAAQYIQVVNPLTGVFDKLPSVAQGMGRLDLARMFDGVPRVLRDTSAPRAIDVPLMTTNVVLQQTYLTKVGQSYEVSGTIADATKPFRVTLTWSDAPGSPAAFKQLINDLDLQVTIGGKTYMGNVFDREFSVEDEFSFPDGTNNFECVFLPAGQTGTWSVVVSTSVIAGDAVPNNGLNQDQDFALVVYNGRNSTDDGTTSTNDTCQSAQLITSFPYALTNTMTANIYHNNHPSPTAARGSIEQFFKIVNPTIGTTFTAETIGSAYDTVLSVWKGECGTLEEVISTNNNVTGTLQERLTWTVTERTTYYIVVDARRGAKIPAKSVLNVRATPPPVRFSPDAVDFGSLYMGETSTVVAVTLTNGTTSNLSVFNVDITGPDANDFELLSETCSEKVLVPGGTCQMLLVFHPSVGLEGTRTAQLVVTSNVTGSPHILPLMGTALTPIPIICTAINSLNYGVVGVGSTSGVASITITNCGFTNLIVSSIYPAGNASNDFIVLNQTCTGGSIAPGESCALDVVFAPHVDGTRNALLRIESNADAFEIPLSGTGVIPTPEPCFSSGNTFTFPSVPDGRTGAVQSVTVTNCGTAPLTIDDAIITGANSNQFIIVSDLCSGQTLPIGGTCEIQMRFAPSGAGPRSAILQIFDNAPNSPQTINLVGTGLGSQPDLQINKSKGKRGWIGVGVTTTNTPSVLQAFKQTGARGKKRVFYVNIANMGNNADGFTIAASPDLPGSYSVKYFIGAIPKDSVEVTGLVQSGAYNSSVLAGGAVTGIATMLRVEVTVDAAATVGSTNNINITAVSNGNLNRKDVVTAQVIAR